MGQSSGSNGFAPVNQLCRLTIEYTTHNVDGAEWGGRSLHAQKHLAIILSITAQAVQTANGRYYCWGDSTCVYKLLGTICLRPNLTEQVRNISRVRSSALMKSDITHRDLLLRPFTKPVPFEVRDVAHTPIHFNGGQVILQYVGSGIHYSRSRGCQKHIVVPVSYFSLREENAPDGVEKFGHLATVWTLGSREKYVDDAQNWRGKLVHVALFILIPGISKEKPEQEPIQRTTTSLRHHSIGALQPGDRCEELSHHLMSLPVVGVRCDCGWQLIM